VLIDWLDEEMVISRLEQGEIHNRVVGKGGNIYPAPAYIACIENETGSDKKTGYPTGAMRKVLLE
jgi:hypothetical protein